MSKVGEAFGTGQVAAYTPTTTKVDPYQKAIAALLSAETAMTNEDREFEMKLAYGWLDVMKARS